MNFLENMMKEINYNTDQHALKKSYLIQSFNFPDEIIHVLSLGEPIKLRKYLRDQSQQQIC